MFLFGLRYNLCLLVATKFGANQRFSFIRNTKIPYWMLLNDLTQHSNIGVMFSLITVSLKSRPPSRSGL